MILNYRSNCLYAGAILFNAASQAEPPAHSLFYLHLTPFSSFRALMYEHACEIYRVMHDFGPANSLD